MVLFLQKDFENSPFWSITILTQIFIKVKAFKKIRKNLQNNKKKAACG